MPALLILLLSLYARAEEPRVATTASVACGAHLAPRQRALPDPAAVVIDHPGRRVLFSVAPDQVDTFSPVTEPSRSSGSLAGPGPVRAGWTGTIDHANELALAGAPLTNVWIDVTAAWPGFGQLFRAHQRHLRQGITSEDCYAFAALFNDVIPPARGADPAYYAKLGFVECEREGAEVAFVAQRARDGQFVTTHAFVPVPGTDWAVHKQGTGPVAALITPVEEVLAQYGNFNPARTRVTYLRRPPP